MVYCATYADQQWHMAVRRSCRCRSVRVGAAGKVTQRRRLFREEAFARRGRAEPINGLLRVTAPHEWLILGVFGLALATVVLWGVFGTIERSVSAACIVAAPGERYAVVADSAGTVVDVLVDPGDEVAAGQPIAHVRTSDLARHTALARARLATLAVGGDADESDLAAARRELQQLESLQASGEPVLSPYSGEVAAHWLAAGLPVTEGGTVALIRTTFGNGLEVLAALDSATAAKLNTDMSARVSVGPDNGAANSVFGAQVQQVAPPGAAPGWLAGLGLPVPRDWRLVRLDPTMEPPPAAADGDACRVRIVLRRDRPVQLLASPRAV